MFENVTIKIIKLIIEMGLIYQLIDEFNILSVCERVIDNHFFFLRKILFRLTFTVTSAGIFFIFQRYLRYYTVEFI